MQAGVPSTAPWFVISLLTAGQLPSQSDWRQAHPPTPFGFRLAASMAYDAARQQLVAFGGSDFAAVYAATRLWDGATWHVAPLSALSPSARTNAALAYDALRQRVVMFGGFAANHTPLNDTWEWNGSAWLQVAATGPWARGNAGMAFDGVRVVLYGGQALAGAWLPFADTWGFDGVSWQNLNPASTPFSRELPQVASGNGEILLFGGANAGSLYADTWRWNGTTWSQLSTTIQPPARVGGSLVFDSLHNRYVLTGGQALGAALLADTFVFANGQWSSWLADRAPTARTFASAGFHQATGRLVLAGGYASPSLLGDTWEFGDDLASVTAYGDGCTPSSGGGPTLAAVNGQPTIGGSVTVRFDALQGLSLLTIGFSDVASPFGALPFALAPLGAGADCWLRTSDEIQVVMPLVPQPTASITIPSDSAIEGLPFFLQAVSLPLPTLDFAGLTASNGLRCVVALF